MVSCSRRRALQLLGSAGVLTVTAGCSGPGSLDQLSLIASELNVSRVEALRQQEYLWDNPVDIPATTRVDFTDDTKAQYLSELFETGRLTVQQWPLVWRVSWGEETVPQPTFLEQDNTFYQVDIADEQYLERERWQFGVEPVEETPPDDAVVVETPIDASSQDKRVVEAALSAVYAGADDFLGEPEFDDLPTVEFHQGLDATASDLIPSPSFDFIKHQHSEEYYQPVTAQRRVHVPEWTYTTTELTDTPSEFTTYARDEIIQYSLDNSLSTAARGVVDDAISEEDPRRYGESAPPSDKLLEVLNQLEIADDLQPIDEYSDRVDFDSVAATYDGSSYRFDFVVNP